MVWMLLLQVHERSFWKEGGMNRAMDLSRICAAPRARLGREYEVN